MTAAAASTIISVCCCCGCCDGSPAHPDTSIGRLSQLLNVTPAAFCSSSLYCTLFCDEREPVPLKRLVPVADQVVFSIVDPPEQQIACAGRPFSAPADLQRPLLRNGPERQEGQLGTGGRVAVKPVAEFPHGLRPFAAPNRHGVLERRFDRGREVYAELPSRFSGSV